MAIAIHSWTNKAVQQDVTTINLSVTVPSTADRILVVTVECRENSDPDRQVDSVYFNTTEQLTQAVGIDNGAQVTSYKYYIVNPTATTANVTVTMKGTCQSVYVSACILTGVDTADPIDATNSDSDISDTSTTIGGSITTSDANSVLIDGVVLDDDDGHTMNAYSGRVERRDQSDPGDSESGASTRTTTTAGAYSMDWTKPSTSEDWAWTVVAIKEKEVAARRRFMVMRK